MARILEMISTQFYHILYDEINLWSCVKVIKMQNLFCSKSKIDNVRAKKRDDTDQDWEVFNIPFRGHIIKVKFNQQTNQRQIILNKETLAAFGFKSAEELMSMDSMLDMFSETSKKQGLFPVAVEND